MIDLFVIIMYICMQNDCIIKEEVDEEEELVADNIYLSRYNELTFM